MEAVVCWQRPVAGRRELRKDGHRLLKSLDANDPSSSHRLIRKFVASSSKSLVLSTLSHLLSSPNSLNLSPFALPMYRRISETAWFKFNPKLTADIVALLHKNGQSAEAEMLISESVQTLHADQDLTLFYCHLIESYSRNGLKQLVFDSYACLKQFPARSHAINHQCYKSTINSLCTLGLPHDAEEMLKEMRNAGFRPLDFEFRLVLLSYGRSGLFSDMRRLLLSMADVGYTLDTISMNIVLSSCGNYEELSEMVSFLKRMKQLDIEFSVRTYNSVLNACPTIMSMLKVPELLPLSLEELFDKLTQLSLDEVFLIQELVGSKVLRVVLEWSSSEGKLDLHGMHLGSAYLILLQWLKEMRSKLDAGKVLPLEITVVCGLGKHSSARGMSPIKGLVSGMMFRMNSPLKIDRKNVGRFVARGKAVKDWMLI